MSEVRQNDIGKGNKTAVSNGLEIVKNLALISAGSAVCAVAVNGILIPHHFLSSGATGLSILVHYLILAWPVNLLYLVFNLPLFVIGWFYVGKRFFFYSAVGLLVYIGALSLIHVTVRLSDPLLCAVLAGIIYGSGMGLILRSHGSSGGTDILSIILLRRFSIRLGTTVLAFNLALMAAAAFIFTLDAALYTLIFIYVSTRIMNLVVYGFSQRKSVFLISRHWRRIADEIIGRLHRGVTVLHAEGGYTGDEERVLYSVIAFQELSRLKEIVRQIDPSAVVVINDTLEVMGNRIGNQPHW